LLRGQQKFSDWIKTNLSKSDRERKLRKIFLDGTWNVIYTSKKTIVLYRALYLVFLRKKCQVNHSSYARQGQIEASILSCLGQESADQFIIKQRMFYYQRKKLT